MDKKGSGPPERKDFSEEDPRLEILNEHFTKFYRMRPDKWFKMVYTPEYLKIVLNFFNKPYQQLMLICINSQGVPQPSLDFHKDIKGKFAYFWRKKNEVVEVYNFRDVLCFGDFSGKPVDELAVILSGMLLPILSNPENQKGWPAVVARDVIHNVREFKNNVDMIRGATKSETILPMPHGISFIYDAIMEFEESEGSHINIDLKTSIENSVGKWALLVREFLSRSSKAGFADGANPRPWNSINFWNHRLRNLEYIYDQLRDPRVRKMAEYLEMTQSKQLPTFMNIFKSVTAGVHEARDVALYLNTLTNRIDRLESGDFLDNQVEIKPLVHCIGLLWGASKYFSSGEKLVLLLREMGNMLIEACNKFVDPPSVFENEVEEVSEVLRKCIEVFELFLNAIEYVRENISKYGQKVQPWTFHRRNVFQRVLDFIDRLKLVRNILLANIDYMKLEKVDIGGIMGKTLSHNCEKVLFDFKTTYMMFSSLKYDILDIDDDSIVNDNALFMEKCEDFDQKLAAIFGHAFEDCCNLDGIFKLIAMIGTLIEKPVIANAVTTKYPAIVDMLNKEVDTVKLIYDDGRENGIPFDKNFAPTSGEYAWLQKLRNRFNRPVIEFQNLENEIIESEEALHLFEKAEQMDRILLADCEIIAKELLTTITQNLHDAMMEFQLVRNENGLLALNFTDALKEAYRELRCIRPFHDELGIPPQDEQFAYVDDLYHSMVRMARIVEYYNYLKAECMELEYDLYGSQMDDIDLAVEKAISEMTWLNNDVEEADRIYNATKAVYDRVKTAQENIKNILAKIRTWSTEPLFQRKDNKKEFLLNLDDRKERTQRRYDMITETSDLLHTNLIENCKLYLNLFPAEPEVPSVEEAEEEEKIEEVLDEEEDEREYGDEEGEEEVKEDIIVEEEEEPPIEVPPEAREAWDAYVRYVDGLIKEEMLEAVKITQNYILDETGDVPPVAPFMELQMILREPNIVYEPSLDFKHLPNFLYLIKTLLDETYDMGIYMVRVDPQETGQDYYYDIQVDPVIIENFQEITSRVVLAMENARDYLKEYEKYEYLWLDDRQKYLRHFLTYSRQLTHEEEELLTDESAEPVKQESPTIDKFKEEIDHFEDIRSEAETIPMEKLVDKWLRIDLKLLRAAILNTIDKWGNLFKDYLYSHVIDSMNELDAFIVEAVSAMHVELEDDDYDGLLKVMNYLFKVKNRAVETDVMFQPLKEIMDLLADYHRIFSEEVHVQLQEIPDRWQTCKKVAASTKQTVAPLQAVQINGIKRRLYLFELRLNLYRDYFKKLPLFHHECHDVYTLLDKIHGQISTLEAEQEDLKSQANLFEIVVEDLRPLKQIRKEIRQLKQVWDYVLMVRSCVDEWKQTLWQKIDVEAMEMECKRFGKDFRSMDKEMRAWDVFIEAEASIKNLLTSLRAVTELQNPAIRDRHWQQLMQATKVRFVMDETTTLKYLLDLNLHKFEDEVKNIVDKSVKEMSMEKVLKELNATWSVMEFGTDVHPRTSLQLLTVSEEIIEVLEENQSALQNMLSSKFIAYFLDEVSMWQRKLSNADQIISLFFDTQRKWCYLESIFIGSEDIRNQLPQDARRFDQVDSEFKRVLNIMSEDLNVVVSTNKSDLFEKLTDISEKIIQCEKALNDYLETKRLAFPRFYFISSADLLDILSNGNQPELVQRHLTKLFDSLARLVLSHDKKASAMVAKENEDPVPFKTPCDCNGKVELWLGRVIEAMRKTLHAIFAVAVDTYDEKPRESWIFDYPAQPALCGTQIWWTTEVSIAFSRLEEGYENALKDYQRKQIQQLFALINILLTDLTPGDRQKIMTICTIDVHSRDVVAKMILLKAENSQAFQWQSQLRHRWDEKVKNCFANICDAQVVYTYEYLGNTPRLVITPLTDRCYITLTQSLHLIMGCAPAGPAGTGKTETTKDLGKAIGMMVYVFNCSEQMDYKSVGNIYKGLAQSGCWGCFDEFNRISVEVLSVVAVQVKTIQDAIKDKRKRFLFLGQEISLIPTVGIFITMNPGYAGRTELPENLKALFRPCAMVVPDFALICEIMLVAEGFQEARLLARKFITLYTLCKELLSKQDHYDWGLRAIKSVLVVAGSLKRSDRQRPEDQVLMRALRDFNIPKIVTDDVPVFMGLIGDLFPALDVPRKRDLEFEKLVRKSAIDLKLQPEEGFTLKVVQLEELFAVRHSVFIVGFTGTGKSMVWKTLNRTYHNQKRKPMYNDLNPKAVTNDELFGIINPATREWRDGLFSVIMRDQANLSGDGPKWIVLDGDIDPMWIESLNTLMDDNKVLTLASNERIALTKFMRLLFEIANLRTATPATVSRAGILYINPADLGWNPYVASWIDTRTVQSEKAALTILFDKYIPPCLDALRTKFKKITPICELAHIQMVCYLLDAFLTLENVPPECPKEWYELYFAFSVVWGFGSALFQDQLTDWRNEFSKWFINEFKTIKFPAGGNVFSYFIEDDSKKFVPWTEIVRPFELDPDIPLQATLVNTAETTRIRFFMDKLMEMRIPVMLIGPAGSGKTVIMLEKLNELGENYSVTKVPFNFYTTSEVLQNILEKPLEKKAGRIYGPAGGKNMVYFVDDMNMPEVDKYFTVQPHTLLKQYMDYHHWYDRQKLSLKDIVNVQFISCMNPTAGSFTIDPRLQRHFCVFSVNFPSMEAAFHIYMSIVSQHFADPANKFGGLILRLSDPLVKLAIDLHMKCSQIFLPTAIKFHYAFTLRDLSNIFQGILFTTGDAIKTQTHLIRLYGHEAFRVYADKLVDKKDQDTFVKIYTESVKKGHFEEINEAAIFAEPLIFCHFAEGIGDPKYFPIHDFKQLSLLLNDALTTYNELVAAMNLVLFDDAMFHICRISRILEAPRGNALLIGVGGSGKQSLTRLSASISSFDVFQVQIRKGYSMNDLKGDLGGLYIKTGLKGFNCIFLMTDAQVPHESFLVMINDILASGEISDLLPEEDIENIINAMRNECKQAGIMDTRENCWKLYIDRVRRLLKVVLCFSPVGSTLRIRGRKFPALVNCTSIDWFHEWPQIALESVSRRFVSEVEALPRHLVESVALYMAYTHSTVNKMSQIYLTNEKRYNYTTPKSFLELIDLYAKLLTEKTENAYIQIERLEVGLVKLASTHEEVDGLKEVLAVQQVVVNQKNEASGKLLVVLAEENRKVAIEQAIASEEEAKVKDIEEDVSAKKKICEVEVAKALPALQAATEALNTLNKNNLTELKSFATPPAAVVNVLGAVYVLFNAKSGKIPKDRSWKTTKSLMNKVDQFLHDLIHYDKDHIPAATIVAVKEYFRDPEFDPDKIRVKSAAAAGMCSWVINIVRYYEVFVVYEPKLKALQKAASDLQAATDRLKFLNDKLALLEQQLSVLKEKFDVATEEKMRVQAEADQTEYIIDLANRLVGGLASENVRWRQKIQEYHASVITLPGDVLLISSFISYVGCFTRRYRVELLENNWLPYLAEMAVPIPRSEGLDPMDMLTDAAVIAEWNNEGLPSDRMSAENACILTNSARWPLMIDPQLQGIKWIKTKYGDALKVTRLGYKQYLDDIESCISNGQVVLLENIGETIDAVLDPVLARVLIKKGKCIKIGDKEVDYDPNFRLIIQTKLANPHYQPEIQAQCTLINFTVTRDGLEEQLLAAVVKVERPDLERTKSMLTKQQNDFKITLKKCEDNLLYKLSSATGNVLGDVELVENLETTKKTATEIESKVEEARTTSIKIDEAREQYRPCAARGSLLYFILNELHKINAIYQFSLKAFSVVFNNSLIRAVPAESLKERVDNLLDNITFSVFMYTTRGLFECDKLIFMSQMVFQILLHAQDLDREGLDFLLRFPIIPNVSSPVDFLTNNSWGGVKALSLLPEFKNLDKDIEGAAKRWKSFVDCECPEQEKFPGEWKSKSAIQRLCMMRALRPDRMTYAMRAFIGDKLGMKYITSRSVEFEKSYEETSSATPVFFILSPGVNPLKDVERVGKRLGFTFNKKNFHSVSLGQGQEIVAENAMDIAADQGHWVILQNIHLVAKWLPNLEKKMEFCTDFANEKFRLYLSAESNADPMECVIPQGILESSIKITNEPPTGMYANLHKALDNFDQSTFDSTTKESEFKPMLFALCYFHAVVAERRKFGPQGWNRNYPFNVGDLTISVNVLLNYLEANNRVPFEDLRYLFGEIMYGGHITDDWDRRLCRNYLMEYIRHELLEGELELAPGFLSPPNMDYPGYHQYIDDRLPPESPYLYGLHPNAEIIFLSNTSEILFKTVFELQPRDSGADTGGGISKEEKVRMLIDDIMQGLPETYNIQEMMSKVEDRNPYIIVAFQECERMNNLTGEMRRSLVELELGLKGELTITSQMEELGQSLYMDAVPMTWSLKAYPSMLPLGQWISDLANRIEELNKWTLDYSMPPTVWLAGFFNPQSFLTAIMQQTARKNEWPLDRMCLLTDVTKKTKDEFTSAPREGSYVSGLFMEGARWDTTQNTISDSRLKELFPTLPVIYIKAITQDKQDLRNMYDCPVYKTRQRGFTFVWTFNLKTKERASKWVLAGVAILLQI